MSENGKPNITKAKPADLQEILSLQYLAYQSEARLLNDFDIPPLKQTFQEISEEYDKGIVLKAEYCGNIIGSVRGYCEGDTLCIGTPVKSLVPKPLVQPKIALALTACKQLVSAVRHPPLNLGKQSCSDSPPLHFGVHNRRQIDNNLTFIYLEKYGEGVECEVYESAVGCCRHGKIG